MGKGFKVICQGCREEVVVLNKEDRPEWVKTSSPIYLYPMQSEYVSIGCKCGNGIQVHQDDY